MEVSQSLFFRKYEWMEKETEKQSATQTHIQTKIKCCLQKETRLCQWTLACQSNLIFFFPRADSVLCSSPSGAFLVGGERYLLTHTHMTDGQSGPSLEVCLSACSMFCLSVSVSLDCSLLSYNSSMACFASRQAS